MNNQFYHVHDFRFTTSGDVPIEFTTFLSGARDINGDWYIEGANMTWQILNYEPDYGFRFGLLRGEHLDSVNRFIKRHVRNTPELWALACGLFESEEIAGRVKSIH